ncbi:MAG: NAD-dependent epimerase/dehydratase family protein [Candidatus Sumerlaeaceae bacterium]|nr:NAD-dependent epimerase/dehydratase family protein [Candidatus Sumerlaeaceae bacterium]
MGSQLVNTLEREDPCRLQALREFYSGKRVVITGGMGFIGSNLAIALVELGAHVLIIDSMIPEYGGNTFNIEPIRARVKVNISDVRDRTSLNYLLQGQDLLFNLAGTLSHVDSMRDPFTDLEINCVSQLAILESCRLYNPHIKIVFAGTRGQYGRTSGKPVAEDTPMQPVDVNGINNVAGEAYHLLYNDVYGIRACSLRMTNTFGPRHQMRHPRQGVLNWFIRQLIDGEKIRLYGTGTQIRDINYVADVVEALLLAMSDERTNGEAFNLGGEALSLRQFVELAIEVNGGGEYELVPFPPEAKIIEPGDYVADYSKFHKLTGWKPRVSVREGIRRTLEYYRTYKHWYWGEHPAGVPPTPFENLPFGA